LVETSQALLAILVEGFEVVRLGWEER